MKLTNEQVSKIINALAQYRFDVYAEMYAPHITHEPWPVVEFEENEEGFYVDVCFVEKVLQEVEL